MEDIICMDKRGQEKRSITSACSGRSLQHSWMIKGREKDTRHSVGGHRTQWGSGTYLVKLEERLDVWYQVFHGHQK